MGLGWAPAARRIWTPERVFHKADYPTDARQRGSLQRRLPRGDLNCIERLPSVEHFSSVRVAGLLQAAWLRPKQTDLVPGKGQSRSRFPHRLSYCSPTTIFLDPQPTPTSSQRNTTGRAGWKRLRPVVTMRSAIARTADSRMLVMSPHPSYGDCPLTPQEVGVALIVTLLLSLSLWAMIWAAVRSAVAAL